MIEENKNNKFQIKSDKKRFFFPDEWNSLMKQMKEDNRIFFELMFNTGARFDEAQHLRPIDFDFDRNNVRLWKTKTRAKKGEKVGSPRTISLSSSFSNKIRKYCSKIKPDQYIYTNSIQGANQLIKRMGQKAQIKNPEDFSTHNIRKTHGMYLKALGIDMGEICTRLGHDANTYISHYGSADIFTDKDMRQIKELLGDLYMRQRRY